MKEHLLEHFDERKTPIEMLVLHSTAYPAKISIGYLDEYKVSAHYMLDENAELIKLVDEKYAARHTGISYWRGNGENMCSRSIGIEICSASLGQETFDEKQIEKLIPFCQKIIRKYKIVPQNVVGHSDIAPLRKPDPGCAFPWKRLAKEGIGLWYQKRNAMKVLENDVGNLLAMIGYDTRSAEVIKASAYAFCRHFLPEYVQKVADVRFLVDNILPDNFDFMQQDKFIQTLKAVAWSYQNLSQSKNPCKI